MGKKTSFCRTPHKASWENYLKNLDIDASVSFKNVDNTAANARQAIKRFLQKMARNENFQLKRVKKIILSR